MNTAIRCEKLFKTYQNPRRTVEAVRGVDLLVAPGECFGLLGPNGAGKTTTVEILEGLLEPTSGVVEVLGMRWGAGQDQMLRERIGITLQETRFQEKLSVLEVTRLFRSFYRSGLDPEQALALVELQEKSTAWVRELSGGQRQRLAVATALVGNPEMLFLDEPTTGLDPQARRRLWDVVENLKSEGTTILLTTHYMDEAERLCDRVAIIDHGRVIAEGTPRELVARLGGEHVIEFAVEGDQEPPLSLEQLGELSSASQAVRESEGFALTVKHPHVSIPSLLSLLDSKDMELKSLTTRHVNLEDVFVSLTGRHIRDE